MALKRNTTDIYGREITDTYIRIVSVEISYKNKSTIKWVEFFSENKKDIPPIKTGVFNFTYIPENGCVIKQAYLEMKKNPDFLNSIDAWNLKN